MKPYILDLRDQGCPMALLLAKKAMKSMGNRVLVIYICDEGSKKDIVRFFKKQQFSVQSEETERHSILTLCAISH